MGGGGGGSTFFGLGGQFRSKMERPPPLPNRMTDTCENIAFPRITYVVCKEYGRKRGVTIHITSDHQKGLFSCRFFNVLSDICFAMHIPLIATMLEVKTNISDKSR